MDGSLYLAPIGPNPQRVLDVGTGTGIWAMYAKSRPKPHPELVLTHLRSDFADQHPSAEVIGTDLSPIQPHSVPPNLKFEIDDATQPWTFSPESFDFVHIRSMYGSVADWSAFYGECYK